MPVSLRIRESSCIYQPVYLGVRDDIRPDECTTSQLKFKDELNESSRRERRR